MEAYLGDLGKTQRIQTLCAAPKEERNTEWQSQFCDYAIDASFACGNPQVFKGPDGFPYFQLQLPEPGKEFQCFVIRHMTEDFLLKEGWGVVIEAVRGQPDWVFSFGDIVNLHLNGRFYSPTDKWTLPAEEVVPEDEHVMTAQPAETFLPAIARTALRRFFQSFGLNNVGIVMMIRPREQGMLQELVFNITPDQFERPEWFKDVIHRISWFLPKHYRYVSMLPGAMENMFEPL